MTQEDKELLLKDLCARLPYGVVVHADDVDIKLDRNHCGLGVLYYEHYSEEAKKNCGYNEEDFSIIISGCFYGNDIKPYLFPLSSITEEIMEEIYTTAGVYDISIDSSAHIEVGTTFVDLTKIPDILHKHHIDYRGLIPKGLAIDATGLNIY